MNHILQKPPLAASESTLLMKLPEGCIHLEKKSARVIVLTVEGSAPKHSSEQLLQNLRLLCHARSNLRLFIDLGRARQMPAPVNHWTCFFDEHRHAFECIYLLAQSKENYLAASILQHLSGTRDRFRIIKAKSIFNAFLKLSS